MNLGYSTILLPKLEPEMSNNGTICANEPKGPRGKARPGK